MKLKQFLYRERLIDVWFYYDLTGQCNNIRIVTEWQNAVLPEHLAEYGKLLQDIHAAIDELRRTHENKH